MLPVAWEAHAEALANADGRRRRARRPRARRRRGGPRREPPPSASPRVAPHPARAARLPRARHASHGPVPSPPPPRRRGGAAGAVGDRPASTCTAGQLRWIVRASYRGDPHAEADYFARLAGGFAALDGNRTDDRAHTHVGDSSSDCANGVGASKLAALAAAAGTRCPSACETSRARPAASTTASGRITSRRKKSIPAGGVSKPSLPAPSA